MSSNGTGSYSDTKLASDNVVNVPPQLLLTGQRRGIDAMQLTACYDLYDKSMFLTWTRTTVHLFFLFLFFLFFFLVFFLKFFLPCLDHFMYARQKESTEHPAERTVNRLCTKSSKIMQSDDRKRK